MPDGLIQVKSQLKNILENVENFNYMNTSNKKQDYEQHNLFYFKKNEHPNLNTINGIPKPKRIDTTRLSLGDRGFSGRFSWQKGFEAR